MTDPPRRVSVDLARFRAAGYGTAHGAVDDVTVGELILVADEDSETLEVEVVAIRPGAADLRVFWRRRRTAGAGTAMPAVHVELGPLEVGDRVELIDEGGYRYPGVVETVEPGRYGNHYRVRFTW